MKEKDKPMTQPAYERLAEALKMRGGGVPVLHCREFFALMEELFTPEEADLAAKMPMGLVSAAKLASYDTAVRDSYIRKELYRTRNMRLAFKSGFWLGGAKSMLMSLTGGKLPGGRIAVEEDAAEKREAGSATEFRPDNKLTFSKVDAVFRSGNKTRDDIPSHLIVGEDVPAEVADFYAHLCPAGVYEREGDRLVVNPPNCVDCKATDILGPRWTPREGGAGPAYKMM